jgi:hypothetical protein
MVNKSVTFKDMPSPKSKESKILSRGSSKKNTPRNSQTSQPNSKTLKGAHKAEFMSGVTDRLNALNDLNDKLMPKP